MKQLVQIMPFIALIIVALAAAYVVGTTWNVEPWWRKYPTPRRQLDIDKDRVKIWRLRKRHPKCFAAADPIINEQPPTEIVKDLDSVIETVEGLKDAVEPTPPRQWRPSK